MWICLNFPPVIFQMKKLIKGREKKFPQLSAKKKMQGGIETILRSGGAGYFSA